MQGSSVHRTVKDTTTMTSAIHTHRSGTDSQRGRCQSVQHGRLSSWCMQPAVAVASMPHRENQ